MTREFNVVIERDSEGYYVASVPEVLGCHTQAKSLDTLMKRRRSSYYNVKGSPYWRLNNLWSDRQEG